MVLQSQKKSKLTPGPGSFQDRVKDDGEEQIKQYRHVAQHVDLFIFFERLSWIGTPPRQV